MKARLARLPRHVWAVGLIAGLFGTAWAMLTPLFQVPDEPAHFSYVQYLAETGNMPDGATDRPVHSSSQEQLMYSLGAYALIGRPNQRVEQGSEQSRQLLAAAESLPADDGGGSTTSTSQPPLYYALGAVVYLAASPLSAASQVRAVRMLSVAMFAVTAMLAAMLAAEVFPSVRWAAAVGGIAVAVAPAPGFIAGGINPDNLIAMLAVALCLAVARGLRSPSVAAAAVVGVLAGLGVIAKLNFAGLVPGAALAVLLIGWRLRTRTGDRPALIALAAAAGAGLLPVLVFVVWTTLQGRALLPAGTSTPPLPAESIPAPNLREHLSYAWQLFLPRYPGQQDIFGFWPVTGTWLEGWLGRYGWLDYGVTPFIRTVGTWITWLLGALALSGLVQHRAGLQRHLAELTCFVVMAVGLGAVIALVGYDYKRTTGFTFEQIRYLFPLLGLYAAVIVAATLGLGRRLGPWLAIAVTTILTIHGLTGLMLTAARYYGA